MAQGCDGREARLPKEVCCPSKGYSGRFCCLAIGVLVADKEAILCWSLKALKGLQDGTGGRLATWAGDGILGDCPLWVVGA